MGKQQMHEAVTSFGFGRPTGIELPGEGDDLLECRAGGAAVDDFPRLEVLQMAVGPGETQRGHEMGAPLRRRVEYDAIAVAPRWLRK